MNIKRYGVAPGVLWRHWADEEEVVVYLESRFETHLLGEASLFLLDALASAGQILAERELMLSLLSGLPDIEAETSQEAQQVQQIRESQALALIQQLLALGVIVEQAC